MGSRIPFVVDVCRSTFEQLDELLSEVCEGMDGKSDWPPPQDKECLAVAGLNLLNLQVKCSVLATALSRERVQNPTGTIPTL